MRPEPDSPTMPPVEGSLAAEANMIVLDTLELIVQIVSITDNFTQVCEGPFSAGILGVWRVGRGGAEFGWVNSLGIFTFQKSSKYKLFM